MEMWTASKKRIVFETLVETEALENEKKLIIEHDSEYLTNIRHNHSRKVAKKSGDYADQSVKGIVTEPSPVVQAILEFMSNHRKDEFVGFIGELHTELLKYGIYANTNTAPKAPNKLATHLRRVASEARVYGIDIQDTRKTQRGSLITLRKVKSDV